MNLGVSVVLLGRAGIDMRATIPRVQCVKWEFARPDQVLLFIATVGLAEDSLALANNRARKISLTDRISSRQPASYISAAAPS